MEISTVNVELEQIKDLFKDKIDYSCKKWNDLVRLNEQMLIVMEQYEMFGESKKAAIELQKFLNNFEKVQVGLGQIEQRMIPGKDDMKNINKIISTINENFNKLSANFDFSLGSFLDSTLLNEQQKSQLHQWAPGTWKLIFKASKDGFSANAFHQKCDNKGKTITVVSANGYIFGGIFFV